jgi:signal transduction histidine kinase
VTNRRLVWNGEEAIQRTYIDLTERRRAEDQIRKLNEELEQRVDERTSELWQAQSELVKRERLATLGQLTATVSHELRNPLGAMRSSIYLLQNHVTDGDPRLRRAADRIDRNITRCDNIIDELLDFTRIHDLQTESVRLDDWLASVLDDQDMPAGIAVHREPGAPGAVAAFDTDRLRRAVINIYDNACQAMGEQPDADRGKSAGTLRVRTRVQNNRMELLFADTGPGIPDAEIERVFEPLYSTRGFGVGLGLPMVRQIMEQHGGGIEIFSAVGTGTEVTLWLPRAQGQEAAE